MRLWRGGPWYGILRFDLVKYRLTCFAPAAMPFIRRSYHHPPGMGWGRFTSSRAGQAGSGDQSAFVGMGHPHLKRCRKVLEVPSQRSLGAGQRRLPLNNGAVRVLRLFTGVIRCRLSLPACPEAGLPSSEAATMAAAPGRAPGLQNLFQLPAGKPNVRNGHSYKGLSDIVTEEKYRVRLEEALEQRRELCLRSRQWR